MKMKKKAWSGRFKKETNRLVDEFNASISFDSRLYPYDIMGSIAHARALESAKILTKKEARRIEAALNAIEKEIDSGKFKFKTEAEDIHMAIEARLTEKIGPLGGKLHTGRSRNDQVALDMRLYIKDQIREIIHLLHELKRAVVVVAATHADCILPGYTHLQRAQPVLLAHHMLAYYEMLMRDSSRLVDCYGRADEMPLGAGALAGSPYNLNRKLVAKVLGFSRVTENSLDSVSDRDFVIEFLSVASIIMVHVSRLSEELIIWSSQEFAFVEFSDDFSTGSSIMPQKKNPDVAELGRGKSGRVFGNLMAVLTVMKGLPLAYNKDMQEDKEPLFDSIDTLKAILRVYPPMLKSMKVNRDKMYAATNAGFLNATDAADYLVKKGLPFRQAHEVAGRLVGYCIDKNSTLVELTLEEWKKFSPLFGVDIKKAIAIERAITSRRIYGGTAFETVKKRLAEVITEVEEGCC